MKRLLADSGSTKTDWIVSAKTGDASMESAIYSCRGLNPHFIGDSDLIKELESVRTTLGAQFDEILFYGAGIGNPEMAKKMEDALSKVFDCAKVKADSDMAGAASAVLESDPGIACIMGTGSNSCHYDGNKIDHKSISLGYIIDDNGGGVAFGRRLLADVFKRIAPPEIRTAFAERYELSSAEAVGHLYGSPAPNRWIASFMPFIVDFKYNAYIKELIDSQLDYFFDREFKTYSERQLIDEGIGFVGSVAYLLKSEIEIKLDERGWKSRGFLRKPLDRLIKKNEN